jgi:uncharacterized membrane protein
MVYCILAYPVLVHLSVLTGRPELSGCALVALYAGVAWRALARRSPGAWLGFAAAAVASALLVWGDWQLYALYVPPIVLPLALVAWWAPTLRRGRTPFVTQMAEALRGPVSREHAAYTRGVTLLWVAFCVLLSLAGAATALAGDAALWSRVTNVYSPLAIAAVFVLEYAYRRWHLRHEPHPGFVQFLRQVSKFGTRPRERA